MSVILNQKLTARGRKKVLTHLNKALSFLTSARDVIEANDQAAIKKLTRGKIVTE